jgi:26S proteasome regulatory subunit N13
MVINVHTDLLHFCWRPRSAPLDEPELDLMMVPEDGHFVPYTGDNEHPSASTNGRIFVLKFVSSSQRHLFWLQSSPQGPRGRADPSYWSPRDRKIGEIVDELLAGLEPDIPRMLASVNNNSDTHEDDDGDATMEDAQGRRNSNEPHGGSGGAGAGATGGDVRDEGEGAREGGADGARA